jgi:hypothetical protein
MSVLFTSREAVYAICPDLQRSDSVEAKLETIMGEAEAAVLADLAGGYDIEDLKRLSPAPEWLEQMATAKARELAYVVMYGGETEPAVAWRTWYKDRLAGAKNARIARNTGGKVKFL